MRDTPNNGAAKYERRGCVLVKKAARDERRDDASVKKEKWAR
jgi:hypothetical protein